MRSSFVSNLAVAIIGGLLATFFAGARARGRRLADVRRGLCGNRDRGAVVSGARARQRPDLERWQGGEEPAWDSPPLAAGIRGEGAAPEPAPASR